MLRALGSAQSAEVMASPDGVNQRISEASSPARKRRRRKTGWLWRKAIRRLVNASRSVVDVRPSRAR